MGWVNGPWLGFDTETTGVSPQDDRIVTAALVLRDATGMRQRTWLIDPGVPIPQAAADVHGVTTELARERGQAPAQALEELATELAHFLAQGVPVVAFNASFDLTILEHELVRHGLPGLVQRLGRAVVPVIDPLVLDRAVDPYRKGKRRLGDLCDHYEVITDADLHTAEVDVIATLGVLEALAIRYPQVGEMALADLHAWQQGEHARWAEGFNAWRASRGLPGPGADPSWPLGVGVDAPAAQPAASAVAPDPH
ncbi:MAG TPA: exonuclease domain-containing protein [Actinomycetaceae bacterium]|nr:exonuclease domain-containing protein [Actinomycetaceae bacterium]